MTPTLRFRVIYKRNDTLSMEMSFFTSCPLTGGLRTRLCEGMIKKDISMLMRLTKDTSVALSKGQGEFSKS